MGRRLLRRFFRVVAADAFDFVLRTQDHAHALVQRVGLDFHDALAAIRNLRDVKDEGFGSLINFTQEHSRPGSFNFTLLLQETSPQQRRTKDYFSAKTWLPAPDPSWLVPELIFWRRA